VNGNGRAEEAVADGNGFGGNAKIEMRAIIEFEIQNSMPFLIAGYAREIHSSLFTQDV